MAKLDATSDIAPPDLSAVVARDPHAAVPVHDMAQRQISLLRYIAAPLLKAVERGPFPEAEGPRSITENAKAFSELVESTIEINARLVHELDGTAATSHGRWLSAEAISTWTAAHYRATGQILTAEDASTQIEALLQAVKETFSTLPGRDGAEAPPDVLARSIKALAPAAASVARYSFGRNAIDLLVEVTRRLTTVALELSARLGAGEGEVLLSSPVYLAMLEIAGDFYKQAHRGEMERLLSMPPEERRAYVRAHDRKVPMDPVWDAVELQIGMLEAMAAHIPIPTAEGSSQ